MSHNYLSRIRCHAEFIVGNIKVHLHLLLSMDHGPLARCVKLRVAHAPGMPGTFSPTPRVSDPDMHHGTCVTHVPWCMPGSLTSGFLWSRWRGKRSRHSRRMRNPQFCISGKRPMLKSFLIEEPFYSTVNSMVADDLAQYGLMVSYVDRFQSALA